RCGKKTIPDSSDERAELFVGVQNLAHQFPTVEKERGLIVLFFPGFRRLAKDARLPPPEDLVDFHDSFPRPLALEFDASPAARAGAPTQAALSSRVPTHAHSPT